MENEKLKLYKKAAEEVTEVRKVFDSLKKAGSPRMLLMLYNENEKLKKENANLEEEIKKMRE